MAVKYDVYLNVLFVADLGRARDFYQNVMGLECLNTREGVDAFFKIGTTTSCCSPGNGRRPAQSRGHRSHPGPRRAVRDGRRRGRRRRRL